MKVRRKKDRSERQANAWIRFNALANLADSTDVSIHMLNEHPMHVRLVGTQAVDYWPATQRAWVHGDKESLMPVEVAEVVRLASEPLAEPLPPGAEEHLQDLKPRAVAEGETPRPAESAVPAAPSARDART